MLKLFLNSICLPAAAGGLPQMLTLSLFVSMAWGQDRLNQAASDEFPYVRGWEYRSKLPISLPIAAVPGDYNRDGVTDLAVLNRGSRKIAVFLANKPFVFAEPALYPVGPGATALRAADFDADGNTDLIALDERDGVCSYRGQADGSFSPGPVIPRSGGNILLASDLDGDGRFDLGIGSRADSSITIYRSQGHAWDRGATLQSSSPISEAVFADVNTDGIPDLVVSNRNSIAFFRGLGEGRFAEEAVLESTARPFTVMDLDADGMNDFITGHQNELRFRAGRADGTFAPAVVFPSQGTPANFVAGDFDGDGKTDLGSIQSLEFKWIRGGTKPSAQQFRTNVSPVGFDLQPFVAADLNADQRSELIALQSHDEKVIAYVNDGALWSVTDLATGERCGTIALGDFDGDGRTDVALSVTSNPSVRLFTAQAGGSFGEPEILPLQANTTGIAVAAGDFTGDRKDDLAIARWMLYELWPGAYLDSWVLDSSLILLAGSEKGLVPAKSAPPLGHAPLLLVRDLNRDGIDDIYAVLDGLDGRTPGAPGTDPADFVVATGGPEGFSAPTSLVRGRFRRVAETDLNGDGISDFAFTTYDALSTYLGASPLALHPVGIFPPAKPLPNLVSTDFTGDGKPDVVSINGSGQAVLSRGPGDGSLADEVVIEACCEIDLLIVLDFNGDQIPDLVATGGRKQESGLILVKGNGGGTFAPAIFHGVPESIIALTSANLDSDGRPDLVLTHPNGFTIYHSIKGNQ